MTVAQGGLLIYLERVKLAPKGRKWDLEEEKASAGECVEIANHILEYELPVEVETVDDLFRSLEEPAVGIEEEFDDYDERGFPRQE